MDHVECVVVGAGIVGLAIARTLSHAGTQVLVLEAGSDLGVGTSGRGSGVIHAGLYYPKGSLKARLCVAGRQAVYTYAEAHGVPYRRTGKLVVATSAAEDTALTRIRERAEANDVDDLALLSCDEAVALEPALTCSSALLSPSTGILDVPAMMRTLRDDAEEFGAVSAFQAPLERAWPETNGFILEIGGATPMRLGCRLLINAAGHGAPALARAIETVPVDRVPTGFFAKGHYFALRTAAPFQRLIYPVPVPGGVGTHLTFDTKGGARFGPDVEWVDTLSYATDPARAEAFYADIRRWWPALPDDSLDPSPAGVRPKISGPGEPARDFAIEGPETHGVPGLVNLFGIESPGVTACIAIAEHVRSLIPL
jgi:L-2-hydroxyglutarate oxidase LhgO